MFTDLVIEGKTQAQFAAYIAIRRIEHTLHYLPIDARNNAQREALHQARARHLNVWNAK